jgi:hypothetical protein
MRRCKGVLHLRNEGAACFLMGGRAQVQARSSLATNYASSRANGGKKEKADGKRGAMRLSELFAFSAFSYFSF